MSAVTVSETSSILSLQFFVTIEESCRRKTVQPVHKSEWLTRQHSAIFGTAGSNWIYLYKNSAKLLIWIYKHTLFFLYLLPLAFAFGEIIVYEVSKSMRLFRRNGTHKKLWEKRTILSSIKLCSPAVSANSDVAVFTSS